MTGNQIWVDGESATRVPADDRGFLLADGVFETLWCSDGQLHCLELHRQRLCRGLAVLGFPACDALADEALGQALDIVSEHATSAAVVRVTVTRGSAPRGYTPPESPVPRIVVGLYPSNEASFRPLTLGWSTVRWARQPFYAGNKLLARTEQVLAAQQAVEQGVDDVLMCGDTGQVISSSCANILVRFGRELLTPMLDGVGISGTRLRYVRETLAARHQLTVRDVHLSPEDLGDADEIMLCNSVRGIQGVTSLGAHHWDDHDLAEALHHDLFTLGGAPA